MDSILIKGGKPLIGEINVSGSKNASLPIMAASLLTDDILQLTRVPKLSDIATMKALLENLFAKNWASRLKNLMFSHWISSAMDLITHVLTSRSMTFLTHLGRLTLM